MSPPPSVRLSVVIPTLRRYDSLRRVLDRLERQTAPASAFQVVVVADRLEPEPARVDRSLGRRPYELTRLSAEAAGAGPARELGWRSAGGGLILFLDDDVLPGRRLIAEHLAWHERYAEPEVAVLGRVRWARELRVTPFMRWLEHGVQFDYESIRGIEAGWGRFYTANVSVKRALLERAGGFDPAFPFHYEDLDPALRMSAHGLRLLYNRNAVGEHLHAVTLDDYRRRVAGIAPAERRFVAMHPDFAPHFHALFSSAVAARPARGRGTKLIGLVPRKLPWVGPRAWTSADLYWRQQLASAFLAAWEAAEESPAAS